MKNVKETLLHKMASDIYNQKVKDESKDRFYDLVVAITYAIVIGLSLYAIFKLIG